MPYDPEQHHRRSVRIPGFDYAQTGWYFVTVCTHARELLLGSLTRGSMRQSSAGEIALDDWLRIDEVNQHVELDELFIMPDHLHGIVVITERLPAIATRPHALGMLVGQFKTHSARRINAARKTPGRPVWQRSFYEHVIRDEADLARVRRYIANNRWQVSGDDELFGTLAPD